MIKCALSTRTCGGEIWRTCGPSCSRYKPARQYAAFGWLVTVRMDYPPGNTTVHYRGCSEASARRKAMLRPHAAEIISVEALTEAEWGRVFGVPGLRM